METVLENRGYNRFQGSNWTRLGWVQGPETHWDLTEALSNRAGEMDAPRLMRGPESRWMRPPQASVRY